MKKTSVIPKLELHWQRTMISLSLALVLSLLTGQAVYADIELRVRVVDPSGQPIEGALVEVLTSDTNIGGAREATTGPDGWATVYPVRPGPYDHAIRVTKEGYTPREVSQHMDAWTTQTVEIELVATADSGTVHVDPPPLARIDVTPSEVTMSLGDQQQFQAKGYDAQGSEVSITPTYSARGGTITTGGLYTANAQGDFTVAASVRGSTVTGTASVHVDPPPLARIDVTPSEVTMNLGDQQQFQAKGYDAQGNEMSITPIYSAGGGAITTGGLYTANAQGDFTVTASVRGSTVTGTASVHVDPPPLARIDVTPSEVTMNLGDQQQFQAKGYDAQGNEMSITPIYSAGGGAITTGGLYTANAQGDFTVTASVRGSTVTGTASVHVDPPPLARIDVTPSEVTMNLGDQQQFQAKGYDAQGSEVSITPTYSARGGTITTGGLYTANAQGDFTATASVRGSTVTGTASVHVDPPPLARIDVTPSEVTMNLGDQQQFQAKGYDEQGNEMSITPTYSASGGSITSKGLYTAATEGLNTVTASAAGSTIKGTARVRVRPREIPWWIWGMLGLALLSIIAFIVGYLFLGRKGPFPIWLWVILGAVVLPTLWILLWYFQAI